MLLDETKTHEMRQLADESKIRIRRINVGEGRKLLSILAKSVGDDAEAFAGKFEGIVSAAKSGDTNAVKTGIQLLAPSLYKLVVGNAFDELVEVFYQITSAEIKNEWKVLPSAEAFLTLPADAMYEVMQSVIRMSGFKSFFANTPASSPTETPEETEPGATLVN